MIKQILLFLGILLPMSATTKPDTLGDSWHFNSKILRNKTVTKQKLIQEGFTEITCTSEDGVTLQGLFLKREQAKGTILFFHGFCPGGKEVFAPFVKITPSNYNLFFVDMRSYGESSGPNFYLHLRNYGANNYKDVIDAIQLINAKTNGLDQIIFGWCSGAFHCATALVKAKEICNQCNVKGLIFDSGFGSILQISEAPLYHVRYKYIPKLIAPLYGGDKKRASRSTICRLTSFFLSAVLRTISLFILPPIRKRESETNLFDKIDQLGDLPVLVIHAEDDNYSPWETVQPLVQNIKNKELWLIPRGKSSHAETHLKQKEAYKSRLGRWLADLM